MEDLLSQDVVGRFPSGAPVRSADDAVAGEHGRLRRRRPRPGGTRDALRGLPDELDRQCAK
jgi:hypothetical protein